MRAAGPAAREIWRCDVEGAATEGQRVGGGERAQRRLRGMAGLKRGCAEAGSATARRFAWG